MPDEWEVFLAKAKECLRVAELAAAEGLTNSAASRAYYAAYLAELAALQRFDPLPLPSTGWQHPMVVNAFNHRLIHKRRLFGAGVVTDVSYLESIRVKADYTSKNINGSEAQKCITLATRTVRAIEKKAREPEL